MYKQFIHYATLVFSFLWVLIIFLDYWYYHQGYFQAISNFRYIDLTIALGLVGAGSFFIQNKWNKPGQTTYLFSGLGILLLFFIITALNISFHVSKIDNNPFTAKDITVMLGNIFLILTITYFIVAVCYVMGNFIYSRLFSITFMPLSTILIKTALGIVILCILLFLLGAVNLLRSVVLWPILLLTAGIFWRETIHFFKATLITPIKVNYEYNWLGFFSLFVILFFLSLTYCSNIRPFPSGFDALAIYMNIPKLISENNGLITGYSPYYWSLFVSLGHILMQKLSLVISLSILGGILSGFAIYEICRRWIDGNYAMFTTMLFFSLPMINFQSYKDIKTDLGLLFMMLIVILVFVRYLEYLYPSFFKKVSLNQVKVKIRAKQKKVVPKKKDLVRKTRVLRKPILLKYIDQEKELIVLLGLFSGMVLGIKLTGLILVFSIIGILTYIKTGAIGFLTSSILFVFIILAGGLDVASGLRVYHFGANTMKWLTLGLSLIGLGVVWYRKREGFFSSLRLIGIYSVFLALIYIPWPFKNFAETGELSFSTLTEGKYIGLSKDVDEFLGIEK